MKILFDHQIFSYESCGGISRYFSQLIKRFKASDHGEFDLSLRYSDNLYLHNFEGVQYRPFLINYHFKKKPGLLNILNTFHSKKVLKNQDFDIFHPTFYNPYFLKTIGNKPFVLTVFDMITEVFPGMFPGQDKISKWKNILMQKADTIIAISENTKNDILRFYDVNAKKIKVIYLGSFLNSDTDYDFQQLDFPEKYILFVGKRHYYKNFKFFIQAISPLLNKYKDLNVICVGGDMFTSEETKLLQKLNIKNRVLQCLVKDRALAAIYKNAMAFVTPSLYEGFCLPLLEAFSCGCPAIISRNSALMEIGGDAAVYFDPEDDSSIQKAVENVISSETLRGELKLKGFERSKDFSMKSTAQQTIKVYETILR